MDVDPDLVFQVDTDLDRTFYVANFEFISYWTLLRDAFFNDLHISAQENKYLIIRNFFVSLRIFLYSP